MKVHVVEIRRKMLVVDNALWDFLWLSSSSYRGERYTNKDITVVVDNLEDQKFPDKNIANELMLDISTKLGIQKKIDSISSVRIKDEIQLVLDNYAKIIVDNWKKLRKNPHAINVIEGASGLGPLFEANLYASIFEDNASNVIVYVGNSHAHHCINFLRNLRFKIVHTVDNYDQCLNISKFSQPFFHS